MKNLLIKLLGFKKGPITVSEAIKIVEAAPEYSWGVGSIDFDGKCCFLGHLAKARGINTEDLGTNKILSNPDIQAIDTKIVDFVYKTHSQDIVRCYTINDTTTVNGYNEDHPKARMLHVLRDMKEAGIE